MKPSFKWPKERDRELAVRYQAGEAVANIASAFGLPVSTVRGRISSLGLLRRALKKSDRPLGGNAAWVIGVVLRTGIDARKEPFADDLLQQLDDAINSGHHISEKLDT